MQCGRYLGAMDQRTNPNRSTARSPNYCEPCAKHAQANVPKDSRSRASLLAKSSEQRCAICTRHAQYTFQFARADRRKFALALFARLQKHPKSHFFMACFLRQRRRSQRPPHRYPCPWSVRRRACGLREARSRFKSFAQMHWPTCEVQQSSLRFYFP
jgi:hypothetical protein